MYFRDEIQEVRHTRDPITSFREKMVSSGLADAEELKQIELEVRKSVSIPHTIYCLYKSIRN